MKTPTIQRLLLVWVSKRESITLMFIMLALFFAIMSSLVKTYEKVIANTQVVIRLNRLFNINRVGSLPEWYTILLITIVIGLCIIIAVSIKHQKIWHRYYWLLLGMGFTLLILAKSTSILHQLKRWGRNEIRSENVFFYIIFGITALVGMMAFIVISRYSLPLISSLPAKTKKWFMLAATIFFIGAIMLEMVGNAIWLVTFSPNLIYEYFGSLEEFCEMLGIILIHYALLDYLWFSKRHHEPDSNSAKSL